MQLITRSLCALVPILALACSPKQPEAERRIVYEVAPAHAAAVVEVLRARLGSTREVSASDDGYVHVDIARDDDEALVRRIAEAPGRLRFLIGAEDGAEPPGGWKRAYDLLDLWCRAHPLEPLSEAPTPFEGTTWVLRARSAADAEVEERAVLLLEPARPEWRFETSELASVEAGDAELAPPGLLRKLGIDPDSARPALWLELAEERQADFAAFTGAHANRLLAVVLDDEALLVATINEPLLGKFHITRGQHGFPDEDLTVYIPVLRHDMLPAPVTYVETRPFP